MGHLTFIAEGGTAVGWVAVVSVIPVYPKIN